MNFTLTDMKKKDRPSALHVSEPTNSTVLQTPARTALKIVNQEQTNGKPEPQSGHTTGPWGTRRTAVYDIIVDAATGRTLAFVGIEIRPEEAAANARLIAAAPELLAALQRAEMALLGVVNPNEIVRTAISEARKAIEKAVSK